MGREPAVAIVSDMQQSTLGAITATIAVQAAASVQAAVWVDARSGVCRAVLEVGVAEHVPVVVVCPQHVQLAPGLQALVGEAGVVHRVAPDAMRCWPHRAACLVLADGSVHAGALGLSMTTARTALQAGTPVVVPVPKKNASSASGLRLLAGAADDRATLVLHLEPLVQTLRTLPLAHAVCADRAALQEAIQLYVMFAKNQQPGAP
jgi:hypothetical protein